ncbi:MAG: YkgJ family cysteine cluster protein [Syntrophomonadaceae bacterium]|nr:YkgJ family cysteine cluster protein [Syntrophomonadaceae bacterium]
MNDNATLADLLRVWEPLSDSPEVAKKYASGSDSCKGCLNNCCNSAFVIPDMICFKAICAETGLSSAESLVRWFDQASLHAGILRLRYGPCVFLNDRLCQIYPQRSLICRFYLCTDLLGETEEMIYSVVITGIAALYHFLEQEGLLMAGTGLTGYDRSMLKLIDEYRQHPGMQEFLTADSYHQVSLMPYL